MVCILVGCWRLKLVAYHSQPHCAVFVCPRTSILDLGDYLSSVQVDDLFADPMFNFRMAISSIFISETEIVDLQVDRPAVVVKTKINNQDITFVAIHLLAYNLWWTKLPDIPGVIMQRTADQNRQVRILLDQIHKEQGVVIVDCDCNSYETSSSYRIFDQFMDNVAHQTGWLWDGNELSGVKQDVYLQHIDHVWYRGDIMPKRVYKIKDNGGSDHLPVLAIFDMK